MNYFASFGLDIAKYFGGYCSRRSSDVHSWKGGVWYCTVLSRSGQTLKVKKSHVALFGQFYYLIFPQLFFNNKQYLLDDGRDSTRVVTCTHGFETFRQIRISVRERIILENSTKTYDTKVFAKTADRDFLQSWSGSGLKWFRIHKTGTDNCQYYHFDQYDQWPTARLWIL